MPDSYNVAILGATGAVGTELLELLAERDFPIESLKLLASPRSAGKEISFKGKLSKNSKTNLLPKSLTKT